MRAAFEWDLTRIRSPQRIHVADIYEVEMYNKQS